MQDDKINLLLVDDQPAKLLSYEVVLGDLGAELYKATSAKEALDLLLRHEFAVVLIDVCMPELDGFELATMIREHPRFQDIAFIFISAVLLSDADRVRGYEMGAVDYVPVPVIPEVLRAKVKVFAELHRKTRALEQLNRELERRVAQRTAELATSNSRLLESEQQLRFATDAGEIGLWDVDFVEEKLFWPPRVKAMFGISPHVPVSMADFYGGLHPEDREAVIKAHSAATDPNKRAAYDVEYRTVGKEDGIIRWVAAKGRGIFDAQGRCIRIAGTAIDITTRKQAEERQLLLAREVDHRARNALAVVQAIMRLTRGTTPSNYVKAVEGRIKALSQAHSLLSQSRWQGADITRMVEEELAPYRVAGSSQVSITGESVLLPPDRAQTVALALHELATNSAKYGALSCREGHLNVDWQLDSGMIKLNWREAGGPPTQVPKTHGFGTKIINATVKQMGGDVMLDWRPKGLHCTLSIPTDDKPIQANGSLIRDTDRPRPILSPDAKRILLVEDEGLVGMMMRDMLGDLGYAVAGPYCSIEEANGALDTERYDCAVLDLNLRGDMVYPVVDLLAKRGTPIVFVTGYGPESMDGRYAHIPVMQKPIARETLDSVIRGELNRAGAIIAASDIYDRGAAASGSEAAGSA
jgi:PAS domain S-box-containing protein